MHGCHRARAHRLRVGPACRGSLPYAAQLIDGVKYMLPGDVKPPEGGTERRRQRVPRAPSLRTLVKWAQKCDSAEQLGERLRRRYQWQYADAALDP